MRILLLALAALLALAPAAPAQPPRPRGELTRAGFLVGEWRGTAWVKYAPDGEPRQATATVTGEAILSGLALSLRSEARSGDGAVVFDADASLRFRRDSSAFRVAAHLPSTASPSPIDGWATLEGCELRWGYELPNEPRERFRFTVRVDATGRREEWAERSRDGGATWWRYYGAELAATGPGGCGTPPSPPP